MIKLYYAKLTDQTPGGLSELAWRLCAHALAEAYPEGKDCFELLTNPETRAGVVDKGPAGKPCLRPEMPGERALYFNLSHSGAYAVCALADEEVGCDIQQISPVRDRLIQRFFHETERAYIGDSDERFTRVWTMRESYAKMTGEGIAVMRDLYVDPAGGSASVMRGAHGRPETFTEVSAAFCEVTVDPSYICTVCAEKTALFDRPIPCFNMTGVIE